MDIKSFNNYDIFQVRLISDNEYFDDYITKDQLDQIEDILKCPVCLDVMPDPVYVKSCQHRFCKSCIEKYIRNSNQKNCPQCRNPIGHKRVLQTDQFVVQIEDQIYQYIKVKDLYGNLNEMQNQLNDKFNKNLQIALQANGQKLQIISNNMEQIPSKVDNKNTRQTSKQVNSRPKIDQGYEQINKKNKNDEFKQVEQQSGIQNDKKKNQDDLEMQIEVELIKQKQQQFLKPVQINDEDKIIAVKFQPIPQEQFMYTLPFNIARFKFNINFGQIKILVCRQFNLNENKYISRINLFILNNKEFQLIQDDQSISQINNDYWGMSSDFSHQETFYDEVISNSQFFKRNTKRIIYYDLNLDEIG